MSDLLVALVPLLCIVGAIPAVALATLEPTSSAAALVIGLPFIGGLYGAGLNVAVDLGSAAGILFLVLATGPAWLSVRGYVYLRTPALTPRPAT